MNSQDFLQIINEAYAPFLSELGLVLETPLERVLKIVNNHFIVIVQARYFV
jgi:hypothetical protein